MTDAPLNVLVLAKFDGYDASTVADYLFSFNAHSRHRYCYVFDVGDLGSRLDLEDFDVILVFWSLYLLGPTLSAEARERIRRASGVKVLFLQDEYRDVRRMNAAMAQLGIQVMFTCVDEDQHALLYPDTLVPSLEGVYTVLPGYVPDGLANKPPNLAKRRPVDVGYRSREVPFYLGDLAREKRVIADRFTSICRERGLRADISVRESDRLYGRPWIRFLERTRCALGTASGASVVDFSGEIQRQCEKYLAVAPDAPYDEVKSRFFADVDGLATIETISPRAFEGAALGCTLVLHEGAYSGILQAGRHYIEVKRDYSNVDDVLERVLDHQFCRELAENAYHDLVGSDRYSYRTFIRWFDSKLASHVPQTRRRRHVSPVSFYLRQYLRFRQEIVPRRNSYLVLPTGRILFRVVRWCLAVLPPALRSEWLSRLARGPGSFSRKVASVAALVLRVRSFRTIAAAYFGSRALRRRIEVSQFLEDVLKLDVVRRARGGVLLTPTPFDVQVELDESRGILYLKSTSGERKASAALPREVERAAFGGRIALLVWDHTAVGHDIEYSTRPGRWLSLGLAPGGVRRLEALSAVCLETPERTSGPLLSILRGEGSWGRSPAHDSPTPGSSDTRTREQPVDPDGPA